MATLFLILSVFFFVLWLILRKKAKSSSYVSNQKISDITTNKENHVRRGYASSTKIDVTKYNVELIKEKYIAIDVETTGLDSHIDRIIEIGAVLFKNGNAEKTFSSLVNPEIHIPASATAINHITNEMIELAPSEREVYTKFVEFLGDAISGEIYMCAHNASFDFSFLCSTLSRLGYNSNFLYIDTLSLSRKHIKGLTSYKQSSLEAYFGLVNSNSHRADSDAENCGKILYQVLNQAVFEPEPISCNENFIKGHSYWSRGEKARLNGEIEVALKLFDKAKNTGYKYPSLYESYAKAYRKIKDYKNEIMVLEEAIERSNDRASDLFRDRMEKAKQLLLSQQENEKKNKQRELEKAKKSEERQKREELKRNNPKPQTCRPIIQYTDDGAIIKEHKSVSAAAKEIGISPKCIRDAASGKQKHAGGFCWRYSSFDRNQDEVFPCDYKEASMSIQLPDSLTPRLAELARRYGASRLVLFGSRARGDHHERSDIDLAVYGMPQANRSAFWLEAEELPTLLKLDIVHILPGMDPDFLRNIEKDGVTLYAED